jgi:hypothetical protein
VLSAPPAFVLSQDQTLREVGLTVRRPSFSSSLSSKVYPNRTGADGLLLDSPRARRCDHARERSRRKRSLLSFQRPALRLDGVKKPPTRARGLQWCGFRSYPNRVLEALRSSSYRDLVTPPRGQPRNNSSTPGRAVKNRRLPGNLEELPLSGLNHRAGEPICRQLELAHRLAVDLDAPLLDHAPPVTVGLAELILQ